MQAPEHFASQLFEDYNLIIGDIKHFWWFAVAAQDWCKKWRKIKNKERNVICQSSDLKEIIFSAQNYHSESFKDL